MRLQPSVNLITNLKTIKEEVGKQKLSEEQVNEFKK